jgi:hypothetical protein
VSQEPWWADRSREDHTPPPARGPGSRRGFGQTWWSRAWIGALEHNARLDPSRLSRGRSYARRGTVRELTVSAGVVRAEVQGSRPKPYGVTVRVRQFSSEEWERILDLIASQLGRTAALLDGELPPEVVEDAKAAGVDLLPVAGEVQPRCSCPDWADPCKHAAAVCYLVADALDVDPFALLQLRGRSRDALLAALRARRTGGPGSVSVALAGEPPDEGVPAGVAFGSYVPSAIPSPLLPPPRPGRPAVLGIGPPAAAGVDAEGLSALASDASTRAWELATGAGDGGLRLTRAQDLARRAVPLVGGPRLAELADRAGMSQRDLTGWAIAWRHAGPGGLAALLDEWSPEPDVMSELSVAAAASLPGQDIRVDRNRLTCDRRQARLGRDGLWYPFVKSFGGWDLAGPPVAYPQDALRG